MKLWTKIALVAAAVLFGRFALMVAIEASEPKGWYSGPINGPAEWENWVAWSNNAMLAYAMLVGALSAMLVGALSGVAIESAVIKRRAKLQK